MKTAVMTDSNSGITQQEAKKLGIYVLPMPFYINGKLYYEDVDLSQKDFYKLLREDNDVKTSQPAPADVTDMWDEILKSYDSIVYIPMSSGLSNSTQTASILSHQEPYEKRVFVADTTRISVTQRLACLDALTLAERGENAEYICDALEKTGKDAGIYIAIDDMKYLKKGGRITPAAAGIASILGIKPILQIQGGKLDAYAKTRGMTNAGKILINAIKKDLEGRFKKFLQEHKIVLGIAFTGECGELKNLERDFSAEFPNLKIIKNPLSMSIGCHTGEGALGVACIRTIV